MRRDRGIVFVLTLAILVAVVSLLAIAAANQRGAVRQDLGELEQRRAKLAAEAGIQRAMAELQLLIDTPPETMTNQDEWALLGNNGSDIFRLPKSSFRLQVVDNCGFLDVNALTEEQLQTLGLSFEQIDSLLDWREATVTERPQGAKDAYYNGLTNPYNARLGRLQSLDELLLVRGFTPATLYGPPPSANSGQAGQAVSSAALQLNLPLASILTVDAFSSVNGPGGDARINLNGGAVTAQAIANRLLIPQNIAQQILDLRNNRPNQAFTNLSDVLQVPGILGNQTNLRAIIDGATISATERQEGRVNINTASLDAISAIPNVTPEIAQQIVDRQSQGGFALLSDILSISSDQALIRATLDSFTTLSNTFQIRVEGNAGSARVRLVAIASIEAGQVRILSVQEPPFSDMPARWGWTEGGNEIILQEGD